jgi:hypothetical protein
MIADRRASEKRSLREQKNELQVATETKVDNSINLGENAS